jgi:hypothetical protein
MRSSRRAAAFILESGSISSNSGKVAIGFGGNATVSLGTTLAIATR